MNEWGNKFLNKCMKFDLEIMQGSTLIVKVTYSECLSIGDSEDP